MNWRSSMVAEGQGVGDSVTPSCHGPNHPIAGRPAQTGADRFITNNASGFSTDIAEIDAAYPSELPDPDDA